jgi:hypothetical protein
MYRIDFANKIFYFLSSSSFFNYTMISMRMKIVCSFQHGEEILKEEFLVDLCDVPAHTVYKEM